MVQVIENETLTPEARSNLQRNEETRRKLTKEGSKYIKMDDKEELMLMFDAERIEEVTKDFGNGPKTQWQYAVVDQDDGQERIYTASRTASESIDAILTQYGRQVLIKVKRIGEGKKTVYDFTPQGVN